MSSLSGCKSLLQDQYPWSKTPFISSAPIQLVADPDIAVSVSKAGGLGFLAASDLPTLRNLLYRTLELTSSLEDNNIFPEDIVPVGIGFLNWASDLALAILEFKNSPFYPAAAWFSAPGNIEELVHWTKELRTVTQRKTKVWIQVGTVASALEVARTCRPDVLVIQASDAGGHELAQSSSLVTLLPEVADALNFAGMGDIPLVAAGGVMDERGAAAAMMLGASGVCIGTPFLASDVAEISHGYRKAILDT